MHHWSQTVVKSDGAAYMGDMGMLFRSSRHDDHCRPSGLAPWHVVAMQARLHGRVTGV